MLYVIRRDWQEHVEAFPTLREAQVRFDELKAEQPKWNLQIIPSEPNPYNTSGGYDVSL